MFSRLKFEHTSPDTSPGVRVGIRMGFRGPGVPAYGLLMTGVFLLPWVLACLGCLPDFLSTPCDIFQF